MQVQKISHPLPGRLPEGTQTGLQKFCQHPLWEGVLAKNSQLAIEKIPSAKKNILVGGPRVRRCGTTGLFPRPYQNVQGWDRQRDTLQEELVVIIVGVRAPSPLFPLPLSLSLLEIRS